MRMQSDGKQDMGSSTLSPGAATGPYPNLGRAMACWSLQVNRLQRKWPPEE